ncbi:hypothetical protein GKD14_16305 [Paeniclostridium sordellii]|nr:hypothetical protein [Paeniclostridium sordellii]MSB60504.1 hypothetical protein [Paeniclostridium sordellii]
MEYKPENIKLMTKMCAGNFIGKYAILNAGIMNVCNEFPYMLQDGTLLSNIDFYNKVKNEFKIEKSEEINRNMQELLQSGDVVDTMTTIIYTPEQNKSFIRSIHEKLRKLQYLILYVQQTAIDTSKTGIPVPKNVEKILKEIKEKPFFFKYARNADKGLTIINSVIDRYAYGCAGYYYTQSFNLMKDVCFTVEDEVSKSKKNVFIDMFDRASAGANENNVAVIVSELGTMYTRYKSTRQGLRNADKKIIIELIVCVISGIEYVQEV